ncbi:hypothetical protein Fot_06046 [Forsythia ovata]|uniref:Uncharacterized protein n=1 Tax=Forsythia ovata TaxID=205694 RepID=A0ABD1WRV0_9LAMI
MPEMEFSLGQEEQGSPWSPDEVEMLLEFPRNHTRGVGLVGRTDISLSATSGTICVHNNWLIWTIEQANPNNGATARSRTKMVESMILEQKKYVKEFSRKMDEMSRL